MRARDMRRRRRPSGVHVFELSDEEIKGQLPNVCNQGSEYRGFDSAVEERFWRDFSSAVTGWTIRREPEVLFLRGGTVMIPDFGFEKGEAKVYFEIIGFWTKEYMEKKIHKIRKIGLSNLIVAVDKRLKGAKEFVGLTNDVVFFKKHVPIEPILERLKAVEELILSKHLTELRRRQLELHGDIVDLYSASLHMGVPLDAVRKHLVKNPPTGYVLVGEQAISKRLIDQLEKRLETLGKEKTLLGASKLIEDAGIRNPQSLLMSLGYKIEWFGIESEKAVVLRKTGL